MRIKHLALALLAILISTSCDAQVPPPLPSGPAQTTPSAATSSDPAGSPTAAPLPSDAPVGDPGVPADIAADVEAVLGATTFEAAVAATRTILEKSGVVITEDPSTVAPTAAGLYLSALELRHIADEARDASKMGRVSFADFATTFGGAALLPPNDALLAQYAELDFGVPAGAPDPSASPAPAPTLGPGQIASGGVSGLFSLAGLIGNLLTSWYRELSTIDACAITSVSYHVPQPTAWRR